MMSVVHISTGDSVCQRPPALAVDQTCRTLLPRLTKQANTHAQSLPAKHILILAQYTFQSPQSPACPKPKFSALYYVIRPQHSEDIMSRGPTAPPNLPLETLIQPMACQLMASDVWRTKLRLGCTLVDPSLDPFDILSPSSSLLSATFDCNSSPIPCSSGLFVASDSLVVAVIDSFRLLPPAILTSARNERLIQPRPQGCSSQPLAWSM